VVEQIWKEVGVFNALLALQKQLVENQLMVVQSDNSWMASFEWFTPASRGQINEIEKQLSLSLPQDYRKFLNEISNGAVLFYDKKYGQWGVRLFGTTELVEKQAKWKKSLPVTWASNLFAYGELFGEANALVFDLKRPTKDSMSYMVLETNAHDKFDDWVSMSRSFHEWLEHLVIAQGHKYWLWK
jgi:hypothetical protein